MALNEALLRMLPQLLPLAAQWVEQVEQQILREGRALTANEDLIANTVGVTQSHRVRLLIADELPKPPAGPLRDAAMQTGLFAPGIVGMTFGHGIVICRGHLSAWLLAHELRHVAQYEQAGSVLAFLETYLAQIVNVGYTDAPLEIDARAHEIKGSIPT